MKWRFVLALLPVAALVEQALRDGRLSREEALELVDALVSALLPPGNRL